MSRQEEQWVLQEKYNGVQTPEFNADCARLAAGEPVGYVIGHVPFLDCTAYLDEQPLIPRSETEFWVEKAISEIRSVAPAAPRILDLCAGSGAIGVAVAKALPEAHVDFSEIDVRLLPTIQKNLQENIPDYSNRLEHYHVLQSDLFQNLPGACSNLHSKNVAVLYDFILTNPPYIDPVLDRTQASVKDYEPHLALYGGEEGLVLITEIIEQAPQYLTQGGQLWIEHEPEQSEYIREIGTKSGFQVSTQTDQYDAPRYSILIQ